MRHFLGTERGNNYRSSRQKTAHGAQSAQGQHRKPERGSSGGLRKHQTSFPEYDVFGRVGQRTHHPGAHRRAAAPSPHSLASRRPGRRRTLPIRSDQRPDRVSLPGRRAPPFVDSRNQCALSSVSTFRVIEFCAVSFQVLASRFPTFTPSRVRRLVHVFR